MLYFDCLHIVYKQVSGKYSSPLHVFSENHHHHCVFSSKVVKRTSPSKDHKEVELLRSLENKILTMPNFDLQKLWADFCQADKAYRQTLSPAQVNTKQYHTYI